MEKLKKSEAALAADSTDGLIKRKGKAILAVLMVNLIDFVPDCQQPKMSKSCQQLNTATVSECMIQ